MMARSPEAVFVIGVLIIALAVSAIYQAGLALFKSVDTERSIYEWRPMMDPHVLTYTLYYDGRPAVLVALGGASPGVDRGSSWWLTDLRHVGSSEPARFECADLFTARTCAEKFARENSWPQ